MGSKRYIYANEFLDIFGVFLADYWDKMTGLDTPKFDKDVVKSPNDMSILETVKQKWGERALKIFTELSQESPLLDRLSQCKFPDS